MTDWTGLLPPAGAVPLITARCTRCHRVAAKYWEHDGAGVWIVANHDLHRPMTQRLADSARARNMIADRLCGCEPPPVLPAGAELAALVARARKLPQVATFRRRSDAPLTIRV